MKLTYPALFHKENSGYWAEFPDITGCYSDGDTIEDAIHNSREALALVGEYVLLELRKRLPDPTPIEELLAPEDGFLQLIETEIIPRSPQELSAYLALCDDSPHIIAQNVNQSLGIACVSLSDGTTWWFDKEHAAQLKRPVNVNYVRRDPKTGDWAYKNGQPIPWKLKK